MDELKPCPMCGEAAEGQWHASNNLYYVECTGCSAQTFASGAPEAAAAWNRRAPTSPPALAGEVRQQEWVEETMKLAWTFAHACVALEGTPDDSGAEKDAEREVTRALTALRAALAAPIQPRMLNEYEVRALMDSMLGKSPRDLPAAIQRKSKP